MKKLYATFILGMGVVLTGQALADGPTNPYTNCQQLQSTDPRAQWQGCWTTDYSGYELLFTNGFPASYVPQVCVFTKDNGVKNAKVDYTVTATPGYVASPQDPPGYVVATAGQTVVVFTATSTNSNYVDPTALSSWVPGNIYDPNPGVGCRFAQVSSSSSSAAAQ